MWLLSTTQRISSSKSRETEKIQAVDVSFSNLQFAPSEDDIACSDRCAVVPLVSLWNLNIVTSPHKFPGFFPSRLRCRCLQPVLAIPRVVQAHESVSKQVVAPELRKHAPSPKVVQVLHRQLRARSQDVAILDGMRRPALQARELASQEVRQRIHAGTPRMPPLASHLPLRCRYVPDARTSRGRATPTSSAAPAAMRPRCDTVWRAPPRWPRWSTPLKTVSSVSDPRCEPTLPATASSPSIGSGPTDPRPGCSPSRVDACCGYTATCRPSSLRRRSPARPRECRIPGGRLNAALGAALFAALFWWKRVELVRPSSFDNDLQM